MEKFNWKQSFRGNLTKFSFTNFKDDIRGAECGAMHSFQSLRFEHYHLNRTNDGFMG